MKTLLVIAGMIAGLSAAHAAEKDDVASVFKEVCMGQRPFVSSLQKFAKARGLSITIEQQEAGPKRPRISARILLPVKAEPSIAQLEPQRAALLEDGTEITVHAAGGEKFEGMVLEFCSVHQDGFLVDRSKGRVETLLGLPRTNRISHAAPLGKEGPQLRNIRWDLVKNGWDYVTLSETNKPKPRTSILRSSSAN